MNTNTKVFNSNLVNSYQNDETVNNGMNMEVQELSFEEALAESLYILSQQDYSNQQKFNQENQVQLIIKEIKNMYQIIFQRIFRKIVNNLSLCNKIRKTNHLSLLVCNLDLKNEIIVYNLIEAKGHDSNCYRSTVFRRMIL